MPHYTSWNFDEEIDEGPIALLAPRPKGVPDAAGPYSSAPSILASICTVMPFFFIMS